MPYRLDIPLQRNEAWERGFKLTDRAGAPIDLTNRTVEMQVKNRLVAAGYIQQAVITVTDVLHGMFNALLSAQVGNPLHGIGDPLQTIELPYDIRLAESDGTPRVLISGYVILSRGITAL
jgi:hypothetical protein